MVVELGFESTQHKQSVAAHYDRLRRRAARAVGVCAALLIFSTFGQWHRYFKVIADPHNPTGNHIYVFAYAHIGLAVTPYGIMVLVAGIALIPIAWLLVRPQRVVSFFVIGFGVLALYGSGEAAFRAMHSSSVQQQLPQTSPVTPIGAASAIGIGLWAALAVSVIVVGVGIAIAIVGYRPKVEEPFLINPKGSDVPA